MFYNFNTLQLTNGLLPRSFLKINLFSCLEPETFFLPIVVCIGSQFMRFTLCGRYSVQSLNSYLTRIIEPDIAQHITASLWGNKWVACPMGVIGTYSPKGKNP